MKKFFLISVLCLLPFVPTYAEDFDLLSEEMLLNEEKSESTNNKDGVSSQENQDVGEQKESFFGFIIQPLSNLFKSDKNLSEVTENKESFLDKSIKAADEGSLEDQMNLAYIYLYGSNGVKADFKKAFKYYDMAAQQNNPIALNNLGSLYFSGIGTEKNNNAALLCFQKASDLGNDNAALNLAFIKLTGGAKDRSRNQEAFELFEKSQKAGNKIAEFMLGYAYYKGFVVQPDYTKAYELIKDSANGKSKIDEAQLVLAKMYEEGAGTVQNYVSAITAYREAVSQGNMEAILLLANIYSEGKITTKNLVLAHALYNIAASHGVSNAAQKRDELNAEMDLESLTKAQEIAQNFKAQPSELTVYIRQTYGHNIRNYIDMNMPNYNKKEK